MLRIRLSRTGARNDPHYRIVVIEKTRKRNGGTVDTLGNWHPKKNQLTINSKKTADWISKGAQPSASVSKLIANNK